MIGTYILIGILCVLACISAWRDFHPKIQPNWSVKDIFMTYPPKRSK